jgi:hypothetical protein
MSDILPGGEEGAVAAVAARQTQHSERSQEVSRLELHYFEDVLPVEIARINQRRKRTDEERRKREKPARGDVSPRGPEDDGSGPGPISPFTRGHYDPDHIRRGGDPIDPEHPDRNKMRPRPRPNDMIGLALSGGGIRSAAVCLGGLQALNRRHQLDAIDYLSTVSGGGYIGASLSAAMTRSAGAAAAPFPFGEDIADNAVIGHLRNYSNYLLPRGRKAIVNYADAAAVILRGLLANVVQVVTLMLILALVTVFAYPSFFALYDGSFVTQLVDAATAFIHTHSGIIFNSLTDMVGRRPFALTFWGVGVLGAWLVIWAALRTYHQLDRITSDTSGNCLKVARLLIIAILILAVLDLQPLAVATLITHLQGDDGVALLPWLQSLVPILTAFSGAVSAASSALGHFLKKSERSSNWSTISLRIATQFLLLLAALALPLAIWFLYLYLVAVLLVPVAILGTTTLTLFGYKMSITCLYALALVPLVIFFFWLKPNNYSLHRLYRDRLSKAFIFSYQTGALEPEARDELKLSALRHCDGPYHIVNTAMNVQGSAEANRRGRDADFFMFSPDFIGSDLTLYGRTQSSFARTADMERVDRRLNLATAMAISGAAVSANMGSNTIRPLSPTLALLNIRLGYWLKNPRHVARSRQASQRTRNPLRWVFDKFYLMVEMLNLLDENSRYVYLSDGGHIENLGVYELLKRGCRTIVVFDAESDPSMSFGSLLKMERYARIDLGVRISLPWEQIARSMATRDAQDLCRKGPHCAVGRITYENGVNGVIIYFKSSITGDEKDYVLDYRKRFPAFPHETTGDQFFSEEQFEAYRALGYHMVDGFFSGADKIAYSRDANWGFSDADIAALRRDLAYEIAQHP